MYKQCFPVFKLLVQCSVLSVCFIYPILLRLVRTIWISLIESNTYVVTGCWTVDIKKGPDLRVLTFELGPKEFHRQVTLVTNRLFHINNVYLSFTTY